MKFKNLLSLKSLIVLGFAIAVIPLFLGVIYAANGLQTSSALARTLNTQVFEQTKTVGLVLQRASDIERKARLFVLLSDPALRQPYERESYESARTSFKQALSDLLRLHVDNKIALLVNELSEKENLIYQQIINSETEDNFQLPIDEAFLGLRESSNTLEREFESHVEQAFNKLRLSSELLEHDLLVKGSVLLLISCAFVWMLLVILSRSIRQLDTSIRYLASSDLQNPIQVDGPMDLHYLGERLEWLRTHLLSLKASKQQLLQNLAQEIEQAIPSGDTLTNPSNQSELTSEPNVQQIGVSFKRLRNISHQLTQYSQVHSTQSTAQTRAIDLEELLETVIDDARDALEGKSIKIKKNIIPTRITGVAKQIRAIFEHILSNAIQFSPECGEIRITLSNEDGEMDLEIEDDGPGISEEERNQVFTPFYRGNRQNDNDNLGQCPGLGLALVREYVTQHQGRVEFIDPSPDHQGACIWVQLPLDTEA